MSNVIDVSVVIRTLNEATHLDALLSGIANQRSLEDGKLLENIEIIVVDSGSTDGSLSIAKSHGCRIVQIGRDEFTFGRSLNLGCAASHGDKLVFVSGHCIPVDNFWLSRLTAPMSLPNVGYAYGRQHGVDQTRFSEKRIFRKYYPPESAIPQTGFFCNNANSAMRREVWEELQFDESLTGLEDLDFGRRLTRLNRKIAYVGDAGVYHIHAESWRQVWRRFEREAVALQLILPEVRFGVLDFFRCLASGISGDIVSELKSNARVKVLAEVIMYRTVQYSATFFGARRNRAISEQTKLGYYYPDIKIKAILNENSSVVAHEGEQ